MATPTRRPVSLETGDCLSREEFHRRYLARPDLKKAELVDGVVYVPSPVSLDPHGERHVFVITWLGVYLATNPGLRAGDNATVFLRGGHEVQPDAFLWQPVGSRARLTADGYLDGPPQLIVEVAASSVSYDLHHKAYRRNGVPEYVVWRVLDQAIDWFRLEDGQYVPVEPDADGLIESEQFPGLRLHVPSMLAGDLAGVLAAVRQSA